MDIKQLQKDVHALAVKQGWWDKPPEIGTSIALCHAELSEALEQDRDGKREIWWSCSKYPNGNKDNCTKECYCHQCEHGKPQGLGIELADAVISILDMCGHHGIDLEEMIAIKHEFNLFRPHKHGGKEY